MRTAVNVTLLFAAIASAAIAHGIRYEANARYVRLVTADSIELATQMWLAVRASVEPKKIKDTASPDIGFEWEDGTIGCRARAIPTAGIDAYGHSAVGYYLEFRVSGGTKEVPKLCAEPLEKVRVWSFASAQQVFVRDYRAIDGSVDVVWQTITGKELIGTNADDAIISITPGKR